MMRQLALPPEPSFAPHPGCTTRQSVWRTSQPSALQARFKPGATPLATGHAPALHRLCTGLASDEERCDHVQKVRIIRNIFPELGLLVLRPGGTAESATGRARVTHHATSRNEFISFWAATPTRSWFNEDMAETPRGII